MDDAIKYNKERWEELAKANVMFSRPWLDLDKDSAHEMVDPEGMVEDFSRKDVLCLAGGGGQQSAALALLGANVTVLDFSKTQLERDQQAARHYKISIRTVQRDMSDLSVFERESFDIVWHAHSLNFIPHIKPVFSEVARVLRKNGLYHLHCWNPFTHDISEEEWNGEGYPLKLPYIDGAEVVFQDPYWQIDDEKGKQKRVKGPKEFRHTLSALVNGLVKEGFVILGCWEEPCEETDPKPGTWEHFKSIAAPFLIFWTSLCSSVLRKDSLPK